MSDAEAVGSSGEAAIGYECAFLSQTSSHDCSCRVEHLWHAWTPLGPLKPDDNYCALLQRTRSSAKAGMSQKDNLKFCMDLNGGGLFFADASMMYPDDPC